MPSLTASIPMPRSLAVLSARLDAWLAPAPPAVAVEIAAGRVAAGRAGAAVVLNALPPQLVEPSAVRPNIADPAALAGALRPVLERVGAENEAVLLLVPDLTARIALLDFDTLPARRDELEALARFRLRKSLPFPDDQAMFSCQILGPKRLLVAIADRTRLNEYEDALQAAGARAAVVLPSGLACLASRPGLDDRSLLIREEPGCLTTAFCRNSSLEFYRAVDLGAEAVFDDIFPSVAYFRDQVDAEERPAVLVTAGVSAAMEEQLRQEAPWAQVQHEDAPAELAVAGGLRGHFS